MSDYTGLAGRPSIGTLTPAPRPSEAQPGGAPLGTIAKLRSTPLESQNFLTAERRLLRFALQSAARDLLPRERVSKCLRSPIPAVATVDVYRSAEFQTAHLGGLQVCASVWCCPVCSAKITERRRVELAQGVQFWRSEAGGYLLLVTYTLRHHQGDSLQLLLAALLAAFQDVHRARWWVAFADKHRIFGKVRSLEVTYGDSGWHPHLHVLYFLGSGPIPAVHAFELTLKERWIYLLEKQGRDASWANGVDVRMSDEAISGYLAKYGQEPQWKIEHEMTKAPAKIASNGGRTAFQLLKDYFQGNEVSGRLFVQYAANFKGKSQLHWSRGLRSLLSLKEEKTDEELALSREVDSMLWAQVTRNEWKYIVANDARAEFINLAAAGDTAAFWSFVNELTGGGNRDYCSGFVCLRC